MARYKYYFLDDFLNLENLFRLRQVKSFFFSFTHNFWGFRFVQEDFLFLKKLNARLVNLPLYFFSSHNNIFSNFKAKYGLKQENSLFHLPYVSFSSQEKRKKAQYLFYLYFYKNFRFFLKPYNVSTKFVTSLTVQMLPFFFSKRVFIFNELQKYIKGLQVRKTKYLFFDAFSLPFYIEVVFAFENSCFSLFFSSFFQKTYK